MRPIGLAVVTLNRLSVIHGPGSLRHTDLAKLVPCNSEFGHSAWLCLLLIRPIGSRRSPEVFVMEPTYP